MTKIVVGISEYKIASAPDILVTYALGSCVGICLYDNISKTAGLAHIMLPSQLAYPTDTNIMKFADTAIPYLIERLNLLSIPLYRLNAKIAGGAQIYTGSHGAHTSDFIWQIGRRNVDAVCSVLNKNKIPILAKDVLKNYGRTVYFNPEKCSMTVVALNTTTTVY